MADPCSQCGYFHPPLQPGEKCPLSKERSSSGEVIDTEVFMAQLRNIVVSRIQSQNIKNHKKLFSAILIELFNFLDHYKE